MRYAARHVPFYRDYFNRAGIDPRTLRHAGDLEVLPLLDKDLVRAEPELFRADTAAGRNALSFLTSGSTGRPMRVYHDRRSLLLNLPYGERERHPVSVACERFRPTELYVGNETAVIRDLTDFYREHVLMPPARRRFVSVREPIEAIVELLDRDRPDVLTGYGGWIHRFFQEVAARRLTVRLPKMVMYMAEALPPGGRELIEGRFGVPVYSRYGAAEAFKIGFTCERRGGFHLQEDLCHVRVVRDDGADAAPGEEGEVVLSNLVNRGTVLLNYPIADIGVLSPVPCRCGRTFKLLAALEGRVEDLVPLADGRVVHPRAVWEVFKHHPDALQYQVVQHEPRRFEVNLVTLDEARFEQVRRDVDADLQHLLGGDAVIEWNRQTEFDRGGGRKFRAVASLCR